MIYCKYNCTCFVTFSTVGSKNGWNDSKSTETQKIFATLILSLPIKPDLMCCVAVRCFKASAL